MIINKADFLLKLFLNYHGIMALKCQLAKFTVVYLQHLSFKTVKHLDLSFKNICQININLNSDHIYCKIINVLCAFYFVIRFAMIGKFTKLNGSKLIQHLSRATFHGSKIIHISKPHNLMAMNINAFTVYGLPLYNTNLPVLMAILIF